MNPTVQMLGVVSLGVGVALGCSDPSTAPVSGEGCGAELESGVVLEGDVRVTRVYVTREYTQVYVGQQSTTTVHYRTCQSHTCWEEREDPAVPLGEAEVADALARCTAAADAAWEPPRLRRVSSRVKRGIFSNGSGTSAQDPSLRPG